MKKVLITGITGQDGTYLASKLLKLNYKVYGLVRRSSVFKWQRLNELKILNKIDLWYGELTEKKLLQKLIIKIKPNIIYNLAAQSFVKYSFDNPIYTNDVNYLSVKNILDFIVKRKLNIKFYQASTSEMYGNSKESYQNEKTPFRPVSPYAVSKLKAHRLIKKYRKKYKKFFCSGILFNHESPIRGSEFVTKKVIRALIKIKYGSKDTLELGNLYAQRDWGYAPEYVDAMIKIMNSKHPDDYVVSTGISISVKEFIFKVCKELKMNIKFKGTKMRESCYYNGRQIIKINKIYFRKNELKNLKGDCSKIKKTLKWKHRVNLEKLIKIMVKFEKEKLKFSHTNPI